MSPKINGLSNYWHVIALASELQQAKQIRKMIYGVPILLWQDQNAQIHAVADVCSHKRSPLSISDFDKNEITCPYHGWKYNQEGRLIEIPSSPHLDVQKLKCRLTQYTVTEQDGFVWILLSESAKQELVSLQTIRQKSWKTLFFQDNFKTNEELLVENFMDATHTAYIHAGVIRGLGEKIKHRIHLQANQEQILVSFAETKEKIAWGLNYLLGKNIRVKHTDTFLLPNLVKVDYYFNDIHRFNAFIACTPTTNGNTQAYISLSFNFGWLNPLIKWILPRMVKKVLQQDEDITRKQFANQQLFQQTDNCVDSDQIHNKVVLLRKAAMNGTIISSSESFIDIYL